MIGTGFNKEWINKKIRQYEICFKNIFKEQIGILINFVFSWLEMVLFDMILYTVPIAPNPTKVMLYIAERHIRGIDMGIEEFIVNTLKGRHKEAEHLIRNPFGTLPVLELDDGTFIFESLSIIHYLERVGDLSSNIAEEIIYIEEGEIIRHRKSLNQN